MLATGNKRFGLEDNIWLNKGVPALNRDMGERAATVLLAMNINLVTPAERRTKLNLKKC